MCLVLQSVDAEPIIAKEDIGCYKLVGKTSILGCVLSRYHAFPYELGKVYRTEINKRDDCVNEGFHSYIYAGDVIEVGKWIGVFCVIPKGSSYYVGRDSCSDECYVSDTIIIKELYVPLLEDSVTTG